MKYLLLLLSLGAALDGCVPIRISKACQAQIDHCLQGCPEPPPNNNPDPIDPDARDTRTDCQKNCYDMCR